MIIWIVYCVFFLIIDLHAEEQAQYECGAHGRFEYCIDDIPGCVIGCHCHPGYYFDTDTKICEPSAKLTQQFRRSFMTEPTRAQYYTYTSPEESISPPTPTTIDPIGGKVDEITKDADDLGDWLYNQFFKTIEKQVINNTNGSIKTRRSNDTPFKKKPKRKSSRKYWQRASKKKGKKHGLRRKLLRITEDDSLFDSSSSSDEDSSYETDSSSYSSSTSSESEKRENDHGHKKFIFFNKAQKPPLPSFIFLPGMDTPFYPPIGLPPPPALPMYPIVPVPPMGPIFPHPALFTPKCDDEVKETTSTALSSPTPTAVTNESSSPTTTPAPVTSADTPAESNTDQPPESLRKQVNKKNRVKSNRITKPFRQNSTHKKMMNKIKKKKMKNPSYDEEILDQEADEPILDDSVQDGQPPFINQLRPRYKKLKHNRFEDVDFKYLSELIHRADLNNTNLTPEISNSFSENMMSPFNAPLRRMYYDFNIKPDKTHSDHRRNLQKPSDESYYTNLGREIASLIRKIDTKGERQVNIELEHNSTPIHPVLLGNNFVPNTFWERYARSPISYVSKYYNNEANYYQVSNENLYNLENKVEIFASTTPPLSLNELENIISTMKKAKSTIAGTKLKDIKGFMPSNKSLNINLLKQPSIKKIENRFGQEPSSSIYRRMKPETLINTSLGGYENPNKPKKQWANLQISDLKKLTPLLRNQNRTVLNQRLYNIFENSKRNLEIRKKLRMLQDFSNRNDNTVFVRPPTTPKSKLNDSQFSPMMFRNLNYFTNNNNQYVVEQAAIPVRLYPTPTKISRSHKNYVKPSYFHHVINNFDFFDQP